MTAWWRRDAPSPRRLALTPATAQVPAEEATWGDKVSQYARLITGMLGVLAMTANLIVATVAQLSIREIAWFTAIAAIATAISTWLTRDTQLISDAVDDLQDATGHGRHTTPPGGHR